MNRAEELFRDIERRQAAAIQELVDDQVPEDSWLEYKTVDIKNRAVWQGRFAEAISGFGNTNGGLLIWGIYAPSSPKPGEMAVSLQALPDPRQFSETLDKVISQATLPPHSGVRNLAVLIDGAGGVVVTYVPLAPNRPLQRRFGPKEFVMRSGESFGDLPYLLLAGMFGRQPAPETRLRVKISAVYTRDIEHFKSELRSDASFFSLIFELDFENIGPVAAHHPFMSAKVHGLRYDMVSSNEVRSNAWPVREHGRSDTQRHYTAMAKEGLVLAPGQGYRTFDLRTSFKVQHGVLDPRDLAIEFTAGADGAVPHQVRFEMTKGWLRNLGEVMSTNRLQAWPFDIATYNRVLTSNFEPILEAEQNDDH